MKRVCFPILLYIFITQISAQEESPKRFDYPNKVSTTSHNAKIGTAPLYLSFQVVIEEKRSTYRLKCLYA